MTDHAAQELNRRIENDLGWSKAEVVRHTGISFKTIDRLMAEGIVPSRRDKRRELALGLGLMRDGVDRLLAGDELEAVVDPHWAPKRDDQEPTSNADVQAFTTQRLAAGLRLARQYSADLQEAITNRRYTEATVLGRLLQREVENLMSVTDEHEGFQPADADLIADLLDAMRSAAEGARRQADEMEAGFALAADADTPEGEEPEQPAVRPQPEPPE